MIRTLAILALYALRAALRPVAIASIAGFLHITLPRPGPVFLALVLAGIVAGAWSASRAVLDRVLDEDPERRLWRVDDEAAATLRGFFRRILAWTAMGVAIQRSWTHFGGDPNVAEDLAYVYRLGLGWLLLSASLDPSRVLAWIPGSRGSGSRVLRSGMQHFYPLVLILIFVFLGLLGAGHLDWARWMGRGLVGTLILNILWALAWDSLDKSYGDPGFFLDAPSSPPEEAAAIWNANDVSGAVLRLLITVVGMAFGLLLWMGWAPGKLLLEEILFSSFSMSGAKVSVARMVEALVVVFLGLAASSSLRDFLDRKIFPRTPFDRGVRLAINSGLHYGILLLIASMVIQAFGVGSESIKWFAGFIGIGVGFGMQNVVNNLASGVILLVERPIKPGDRVRVGSFEGEVTRISVRATTIRSLDNVETIVPNSELVGTSVTNWNFSDDHVRLGIPVGVAYGSDVKRVRDSLLAVAQKHQLVLRRPPPEVRFQNFGDSSLNFELMVWTAQPHLGPRIHSDLNYAIDAEFRRKGIEIPFPQRDLHIRSGLPGVEEEKKPVVEEKVVPDLPG